MISLQTGEIRFSDGWLVQGQASITDLAEKILSSRRLPIPGWRLYDVGVHESEYGKFEVMVVCGPDRTVCLAILTHRHSFYEADTWEDGERRVYHEEILSRDLKGRRTYPWGDAFCRFHAQDHQDRLIVAYTGGGQVPQEIAEVLLNLEEHERLEQNSEL